MKEIFLGEKQSLGRNTRVGDYKALRGNPVCALWLQCGIHIGMLKYERKSDQRPIVEYPMCHAKISVSFVGK